MANTTNLNLYVTDDNTVKLKNWIAQMGATTSSNMTKIDAAYAALSSNITTINGDITTINNNISNITNDKQAKHKTVTASLTAAGWSSNSQTVTVTGVTASNTVIVSPAPADMSKYIEAEIVCTAQAANTLTFTAVTVPTSAVSINVVILD